MIRRDTTLPDGSPGWILISQIEHVRISAELAAAWGGPNVELLPFPEVLIPTILRHDDGWSAWESRPEIEPTQHRPYNFLEMPEATAHAIWSASISGAADLGPFAQATIAGHFVELRRRHPGHDSAEASSFLSHYEPLIRDWRAKWEMMSPDHTPRAADRALAALQFFDAWSLWLCCSESPSATDLAHPNPFSLHLEPRPENGVAVRPWPFSQKSVEFSAVGRLVPARQFGSADELWRTSGKTAEIRWKFFPADSAALENAARKK